MASQEECQQHQKMIARLSPDNALYIKYRESVDSYINMISHIPKKPKAKMKFIKSDLFNRDYLVIYSSLFNYKDMDAVAGIPEAAEGWDQPSPIVLVPLNKHIDCSILEHEFVHINQIILGLFPKSLSGNLPKDIVECFYQYMRSEYEAAFLQNIRWPELYKYKDISLNHWCILRGYTQGLERIIVDISAIDIPSNDIEIALESIQCDLQNMFLRMEADQNLVPWFKINFPICLGIAMVNVFEWSVQNNSFLVLAEWFKKNFEKSDSIMLYDYIRQHNPLLYRILFE